MIDKNRTAILNFVGGEISPQCVARADLDLLQKALARVENFVILPQGGITKRPGTYNLGLTKNNGAAAFIPFQFSASDALMLVATDSVFRFYRNDAVVLNSDKTIQGVDLANPAKIYVGNHGFANGNEVFITGINGTRQLNGRFFLVANSTTAPKTITAISKANPGVFTTSAAHGFSVNDRVNIANAAGGDFTQVNGDWLVNTTPTGTTFTVKTVVGGVPLNTTAYTGAYTASSGRADVGSITLQDAWGTNINATAYSAWISGGTIASIFELTTPYQAQDLSYIRTSQTADIMYIACKNEDLGSSYSPYKLVRNGFTDWTLNTYVRTADPFPAAGLLVLTPTAITKANPCRVTVASAAALNVGDVLYASKIGGMTELIGNFYVVNSKTVNSFTLENPDGTILDSTAFTTFTTGGTFTRATRNPACVAFSADGRLVFASTFQNPEGYWASKTPSKFLTRYDDFTVAAATATDPNLGMAYSFAPVDNKIDTIREVKQFGGNFALLGASSIRLIYGAQKGQPPTPISINTLPTLQGSARVPPIVINWNLLFVDVNQQRLRGLQYNLAYDTYQANDYNLTSEHFGLESQFVRLAYTKGTPDMVFCLRADGTVLAFSFNNIENIAGWTRIIAGGSGRIEDIATIRKSNGTDELWLIVSRTQAGKTYRSVEVMDVWPIIPQRESFYGGVSEAQDETDWQNAAYEANKASTFLDSALTFDGTVRGINSGADLTITGLLTAGSTITLTASTSVFQAADVGSQIWKNYNAFGQGGGRALITGYTSGTQVTAYVVADFNSSAVIPAGSWAFAVNALDNLYVYEGISMGIQADGGGQSAQTVANGRLTLANNLYASKVQIGYPYTGRLITQNIDFSRGSAPRNIRKVKGRFHNSSGGKIGMSAYSATPIVFNKASQKQDRPPAPFTGLLGFTQFDNWSADTKRITVLHHEPTPFTLLSLEMEGFVSETP